MPENDPVRLRAEERDRVEAGREWVKGHFTVEPDERYGSIEGKLRVIDTILKSRWVTRDETWKLQALGIALGDALAQKLMLDWVTVDDEFGSDPALNWPGTTIFSYPLTMIAKRIEQGETIDVQVLFDTACSELNEMAFSGRYI